MKVEDIDFDNILFDKNSYENILVYSILYKTIMGAKLLGIRLEKLFGVINIYGFTRYLELFDSYYGIYAIYDKINYLLNGKSDYKYDVNHNFARIRIDSYNFLPIEKILTFHNIMILIKSVVNRNKNNYYFNTFLEKCLYEDKSNT